MKKKFGDVVGLPITCNDKTLLKWLPNAVSHLVKSMQALAEKNNGVIDLSSFQFVYKHYSNDLTPLGIQFNGIDCKAILGLKCDIELPEEEDKQTCPKRTL